MKTHTLRLVVLSLPLVALSACGGGIGSGLPDVGDPVQSSFELREDRFLAMADRFGSITPLENMPRGGTASYSGAAVYMNGNGEEIVSMDAVAAASTMSSDMELNARFDDGSVHGTFTNFETRSGGELDGRIHLDNGIISGADMAADLSGSLSGAGENAAVQGLMRGSFSGEDVGAVAGAMSMVFSGEGENVDVTGVFIGERN